MIELVIKNYLDEAIDCPVYLEHPSNPPEEYIIFEKTGSTCSNFVESATIAFQSYSTSLFKACQLNDKVKKTVDNMISLNEISGVHLIGDYNFTDTTTKKYRYQAVYQLNIWEG